MPQPNASMTRAGRNAFEDVPAGRQARHRMPRMLLVTLLLPPMVTLAPSICGPTLAAPPGSGTEVASTPGTGVGECPVTPIEMGQTVQAALGERSCTSEKGTERFLVDRYRFDGVEGRRIVILTYAHKQAFRPSVTLIREADRHKVAGAGPIGSETRLPTGKWPLELPSDGAYLIEVTSTTADQRGPYTVKMGQACGERGNRPRCDDGNACTYDTCDLDGICVHPPNDTAACEDHDACTVGDRCAKGRCAAGSLANCDDGNACTDDACDATTGCIHSNNTGACDDGNACTEGDTCARGRCLKGRPTRCDDANRCTDDSCNPATGCVHSNNTGPCEDNDACTFNDVCTGGRCRGGPPADCDDGNPCTDDTCDPAAGCVYSHNTAACDDGNACTTDDACAAGRCRGGSPAACDDGNPCTDDTCTPATGCVHAHNTAACDDGDRCTRIDRCGDGHCTGRDPVACAPRDQCHAAGRCDPETGDCSNPPVADGASCDDGNACTTGDACTGGRCAGGGGADCDDDNPCTDDTCTPPAGCVHTHNTAACDDGNACTFNDTCAAGRCRGGPPADCDDGNPCTDDTCAPPAGCVHTNATVACDDDDACTTADTCEHGRCRGGQRRDCDDGNPCTDDGCDPAMGCVYSNNTARCDDDNACTSRERCTEGRCVGDPPAHCSDGNPCTDDTCDPATGCVYVNNAASCDDGSACTTGDACVEGRCVGGPPPVCDDENACTDDACDPATGCSSTPNTEPCDDGSLCTRSDTCKAGTCRSGDPVMCTALDACHAAGECDPATGACANPPVADGAACDDGNACTTADACRKGRCRGGPPPDCDDGNPCTDDACKAATGCVHGPNAAPCDDGNLCTRGDICAEGRCTGGPRTDCDDGNACTRDSCDPAAGCEHTSNPGRCDGEARIAAERTTRRASSSTPRAAAATSGRRPPRALARGPVWRIQLAAVRSAEIAESLVERFRDRYVDLVGDLDLAVERVDLGPGKGVFYRIQGGAFPDRVSAAEVCDALTRREVECVVVSQN